MSSLYEINSMIERCFRIDDEVVDGETGEIFDAEYLDNLEMERDEKIRNIALFYKNLVSDADQLDKEAKVFAKRAKSAANRAENLKKYLQFALNGEKRNTTEYTVSYRTTKDKVSIDDCSAIPEEYIKGFNDFSPSEKERMVKKTAIKEAILSGKKVAGAHLEDSVSMQIK